MARTGETLGLIPTVEQKNNKYSSNLIYFRRCNGGVAICCVVAQNGQRMLSGDAQASPKGKGYAQSCMYSKLRVLYRVPNVV